MNSQGSPTHTAIIAVSSRLTRGRSMWYDALCDFRGKGDRKSQNENSKNL